MVIRLPPKFDKWRGGDLKSKSTYRNRRLSYSRPSAKIFWWNEMRTESISSWELVQTIVLKSEKSLPTVERFNVNWERLCRRVQQEGGEEQWSRFPTINFQLTDVENFINVNKRVFVLRVFYLCILKTTEETFRSFFTDSRAKKNVCSTWCEKIAVTPRSPFSLSLFFACLNFTTSCEKFHYRLYLNEYRWLSFSNEASASIELAFWNLFFDWHESVRGQAIILKNCACQYVCVCVTHCGISDPMVSILYEIFSQDERGRFTDDFHSKIKICRYMNGRSWKNWKKSNSRKPYSKLAVCCVLALLSGVARL